MFCRRVRKTLVSSFSFPIAGVESQADKRTCGLAPTLFNGVDPAGYHTLVRAIENRCFFRDHSLLEQFEHGHVERLPPERGGRFDNFVECFAFSFTVLDRFLRSKAVTHISSAAMRPPPTFGSSRCDTIQRTVSARRIRICCSSD